MKLINSSVVVDEVTTIPTVTITLELEGREIDYFMTGIQQVLGVAQYRRSTPLSQRFIWVDLYEELYRSLKHVWMKT